MKMSHRLTKAEMDEIATRYNNTSPIKLSRAGCIIVRLNKRNYIEILAVKESKSNYWGFPKGGKEMNENLQNTACRELFEETNLRVNPANFKKIFIYGEYIFYLLHQFEGEPIADGKEILEVKWIECDIFRKLYISSTTSNVLRRMNKYEIINYLYDETRACISMVSSSDLTSSTDLQSSANLTSSADLPSSIDSDDSSSSNTKYDILTTTLTNSHENVGKSVDDTDWTVVLKKRHHLVLTARKIIKSAENFIYIC